MPDSFGTRACTLRMFKKQFRTSGPICLSTYLGVPESWGFCRYFRDMPRKGTGHHGRTGIVFNVTKATVSVRVNSGRIIEKRIHVRIEHVRKSKCQVEAKEEAREIRNSPRERVDFDQPRRRGLWDSQRPNRCDSVI